MIFPALSGLLVCLAYPRPGWSVVAWVALIPLVLSVRRSTGGVEAALRGLVFGIVVQICLLPWIPGVLRHYGGVGAVPAWALFFLMCGALALFPAAAMAALRWCRTEGGEAWLLLTPFFWVSQEYAIAHFPFGGFPWLLIGYTQSSAAAITQAADIFGVYGVSWLLAAFAGAAVFKLSSRPGRLSGVPLAVGALLVATTIIYGLLALQRWPSAEAPHVVTALQSDITVDEADSVRTWKFGQGYIQLARSLVGRAELLLLPESPAPLNLEYDASYRDSMVALARQFPLGLVLSNIGFGRSDDAIRYYNSAYLIDGDGTLAGRYDKIHLVPFGEYVPLRNLLPFMESISKDVGGFSAGTRVVTLPVGGHPSGVLVCFEAVFPQLCREFVLEGAQLLINLTNDAWYGDSAAPHQHLAIARWRAIENRRYLLRAANSGISAVIDPAGRVRAQTRLLEPDVLLGRFDFASGTTFYSRHGDVLPGACAIISGLALAIAAFARKRRRLRGRLDMGA